MNKDNAIRDIEANEVYIGGDLICPHCSKEVEYDEYFDSSYPVECPGCFEVFRFTARREIKLTFETLPG